MFNLHNIIEHQIWLVIGSGKSNYKSYIVILAVKITHTFT